MKATGVAAFPKADDWLTDIFDVMDSIGGMFSFLNSFIYILISLIIYR